MRRQILFAVVLLAACAAPAVAQPGPGVRPERPYRGLFGGGIGDSTQSLFASLSLSGGYDEDLLSAARGRTGAIDEERQRAGAFGGAQAGLSYRWAVPRASISASYGASGRYFGSFDTPVVIGQGGSVSGQFVVSPNITASAAHRLVVQPQYAWTPVQDPFDDTDVTGAPDLDFALTHDTYLRHVTTGALAWSRPVTRRLSASASYTVGRHHLEDSGDRLTQSVGGGVRYDLSRGLGLNLGYRYRYAQYSSASSDRTFDDHIVNAGLSYNKALSFSRRTTLSFSTGTGITSYEGDSTRVRLSGRATLAHEIGRSWSATLGYGRGWRYTDTFEQPVFSDSLSAGLGGLISRRLQFSMGVAATEGGVGFSERNGFVRVTGSAGLTWGLTQFVGLSLSYVYYRHDFQDDVVLPPGVLRVAERQGVRAGIQVIAPIFQRSRRPDAPR